MRFFSFTPKFEKYVGDIVSNLAFHWIHQKKLGIPNFTKAQLKKDIREVIDEAFEQFCPQKAQIPVIGCHIKEDEIWFSLWTTESDPGFDDKTDISIKWDQFSKSVVDSDPDERDWFRRKFLALASDLRNK